MAIDFSMARRLAAQIGEQVEDAEAAPFERRIGWTFWPGQLMTFVTAIRRAVLAEDDAERTPWYSARVNPLRVGFYEFRNNTTQQTPYQRFFDGENWRLLWRREDGSQVLAHPQHGVIHGVGQWRGLTKPASKGEK